MTVSGVVKLSFDPAMLEVEKEAWPAFHYGGMTLAFWALYKKSHITPDTFRASLVELGEYYKALDGDDDDARPAPYTNVDEFLDLLKRCNIWAPNGPWVAQRWDHFNLNVRRSVLIEWEVLEPVTKRMSTSGGGDKSVLWVPKEVADGGE